MNRKSRHYVRCVRFHAKRSAGVDRGWKERPKLRKVIERDGLYPAVYVTNDGMIWDGMSAFRANGKKTMLCGSLDKQMRKMVSEGRWPELAELKIDISEWWRLHDLLEDAGSETNDLVLRRMLIHETLRLRREVARIRLRLWKPDRTVHVPCP